MRKVMLLFLILTAFASCKQSDPEPIATVQTEGINIKYDQSRQLEVKLGNQILDPHSFIWKIGDKTVGSVDNSGFLQRRKLVKLPSLF